MTIANTFQKILNKLDLKPNTIWLAEGSEFHKKINEIMRR